MIRSGQESRQPGAGGPGQVRPAAAESLARAEVLSRRHELGLLLRTGKRVSGGPVYLRYLRHEQSPSPCERRVAFLVPRQIRKAVVRNRLKRWLREVYRRNKDWFPRGYDYALQLGSSATELGFAELADRTRQLTDKVSRDGRTA
jgi:ribonuclease P protein component